MAFKNAKTLTASKPAAKKSQARQVEVTNLKNYAALVAIKKAVTGMLSVYEEDVKSQAVVEFIKTGSVAKKRPENFEGIDEDTTASIQLKKKASNIALSPEEVDLLTRFSIPTETVTEVHEAWVIDPEAAEDDVAKAAEVLEAAGLDHIIMRQPGKSKTVVAEAALDTVFQLTPEVIGDLLPVIASIAVRPKADEAETAEAFDTIAKLFQNA